MERCSQSPVGRSRCSNAVLRSSQRCSQGLWAVRAAAMRFCALSNAVATALWAVGYLPHGGNGVTCRAEA
jgi:hypothetical protein